MISSKNKKLKKRFKRREKERGREGRLYFYLRKIREIPRRHI